MQAVKQLQKKKIKIKSTTTTMTICVSERSTFCTKTNTTKFHVFVVGSLHLLHLFVVSLVEFGVFFLRLPVST